MICEQPDCDRPCCDGSCGDYNRYKVIYQEEGQDIADQIVSMALGYEDEEEYEDFYMYVRRKLEEYHEREMRA